MKSRRYDAENVERIDGRNASGREPGWTGAQDFISQ